MAEPIKIVYLNLYEDITSVIDRLENIDQSDIILFIPYDSYISQNVTNFKILKREEIHLGKNIIIVSPDIVVREFARTVGLPTFEEIEDVYTALKEKGLKKKITTKVFDIIGPSKLEVSGEESEKFEPEPEQEFETEYEMLESEEKFDYWDHIKEKEKEFKTQPEESELLSYGIKKESRLKKLFLKIGQLAFINKIFVGIIIISVIIGLLSIYLLLGEALVKIYPEKEMIDLSLKIIADKSASKVDFKKLEIPSQLIVVEKNSSEEFFATGKKFAKEKARGIITVYNSYSSSPQTLVKTTRFLSQDGKLFRTTKTIVVPGAKVEDGKLVPSSIDVEVIADQIGEEYNISPSSFTIPGFRGSPKYNGFYGKSKDYMKGGADGEVSYITKEDVEKARDTLAKKLFDVAKNELENQIPQALKIIPNSQEDKIISFEVEPNENSIATKFVVKMKTVSYVFLFDQEDLSNLIHQSVLSKITNKKIPDINTQKIEFKSSIVDFSRGIVNLNITASEIAYADIDEKALKLNLAGKRKNEVNDVFATETNIEKADVVLWPFWLLSIPKDLDKIKIEIIK